MCRRSTRLRLIFVPSAFSAFLIARRRGPKYFKNPGVFCHVKRDEICSIRLNDSFILPGSWNTGESSYGTLSVLRKLKTSLILILEYLVQALVFSKIDYCDTACTLCKVVSSWIYRVARLNCWCWIRTEPDILQLRDQYAGRIVSTISLTLPINYKL